MIGSKLPVEPNDVVNLGRSFIDTFRTGMHMGAVIELERRLLPRAEDLAIAIKANRANGRT